MYAFILKNIVKTGLSICVDMAANPCTSGFDEIQKYVNSLGVETSDHGGLSLAYALKDCLYTSAEWEAFLKQSRLKPSIKDCAADHWSVLHSTSTISLRMVFTKLDIEQNSVCENDKPSPKNTIYGYLDFGTQSDSTVFANTRLTRNHIARAKNSIYCTNITKVIFNGNATVVFWNDGTKTVVKRSEDDHYSKETAIAIAYFKHAVGDEYYHYVMSALTGAKGSKVDALLRDIDVVDMNSKEE